MTSKKALWARDYKRLRNRFILTRGIIILGLIILIFIPNHEVARVIPLLLLILEAFRIRQKGYRENAPKKPKGLVRILFILLHFSKYILFIMLLATTIVSLAASPKQPQFSLVLGGWYILEIINLLWGSIKTVPKKEQWVLNRDEERLTYQSGEKCPAWSAWFLQRRYVADLTFTMKAGKENKPVRVFATLFYIRGGMIEHSRELVFETLLDLKTEVERQIREKDTSGMSLEEVQEYYQNKSSFSFLCRQSEDMTIHWTDTTISPL